MRKLSEEQAAELKALAEMPDEDIDFSDIPELTSVEGAAIGKFYRPIKQPVTIRLDADVLDWLKKGGKGYQGRVNAILREAMARTAKKAA